MLSPSDRTVLIEVLRPPAGFRLDRVIATTYSLDLVALLTLPLSFTLLAGDGLDESGRADPVAMLDALRRHAGRIHIFCQAGRIAVPPRGQPLFGYMESSITEAVAPQGGSFHPKVTVVRYAPDSEDASWEGRPPTAAAAHFKVLCGTRNLTFDRSWDTLLVLEGDLATNRTRAFSRNRPLAEFIKELPGLAARPVADEIRGTIKTIADELLRVRFEIPQEFQSDAEALTFWPIGLKNGGSWPFNGRLDRMAVISPFLDAGFLEKIKNETDLCAVVSRAESLAQLPRPLLDAGPRWYILAEGAEAESGNGEATATPLPQADSESGTSGLGIAVEPSGEQLHGLHAKLYVADEGWDARIWTGSANATSRAFEGNVEFMVELRGRKSKLGIDTLLGLANSSETEPSLQFSSLLQPYKPPEDPVAPDDIKRQLENLLEEASQKLVKACLVARVTRNDSGAETLYDVSVQATSTGVEEFPPRVIGSLRPISLPPEQSAQLAGLAGTIATFPKLAFLSLTAFCAVTLIASVDGGELSREFVLRIPLDGAPADRENQLLLAILSDREHLLRYLLMLLGSTNDPGSLIQGHFVGCAGTGPAGFGSFETPLLENILRTYAEYPAKLGPIGKLICDLEATEAGRKILPEELRALWDAVQDAEGEHIEQT